MAGTVADGYHVDTGAQLFGTTHQVALGMCDELGLAFDHSPEHVISGFHNRRKDKLVVPDPSSVVNLTNLKTMPSFSLFSPKGQLQRCKFRRLPARRRDDFSLGNSLRLLDLDMAGSFADFVRR